MTSDSQENFNEINKYKMSENKSPLSKAILPMPGDFSEVEFLRMIKREGIMSNEDDLYHYTNIHGLKVIIE